MDARADMFVEAAQWLRLTGDHEGARRLLERALALDPSNSQAREHLSESSRAGANTVVEASAPSVRPPMPPRVPPLGVSLGPPVLPRSAWELEGGPGVDMVDGQGRPGDALDVLCGSDVPVSPRPDTPLPVPVPRAPEPAPRPEAPKTELDVLLDGATELLGLDDCTGALELLRKAGERAPADPRVAALQGRAERTLMAMLESKLGDARSVPRPRLQPDEVIWLNLDHRAGFVLAQIDGQVSYEDLYALSGMARLDTARILAQLLDEGVIETSPAVG